VRPVLRPGLRRLRVDGALHLTDDRCDVVLDDAGVRLVDAADGIRDEAAVLEHAAGGGALDRALRDAWDRLLRRGLLVDADAHLRRVADLSAGTTAAVADPAAADPTVVAPLVDLLARPDGEQRWAARRAGRIRLCGHGATRPALHALLTGSGVVPQQRDGDEPADLVVLTDDHEPSADLLARLLRDDVTHLVGGLRTGDGRIGPLVVPGWTACSRCHDLRRSAADPSWRWRRAALCGPAIHPLGANTASPLVVAVTTALLAGEVLAFLEGRTPHTAGGVLSVTADDPIPTREPLEPHPWCGCLSPE